MRCSRGWPTTASTTATAVATPTVCGSRTSTGTAGRCTPAAWWATRRCSRSSPDEGLGAVILQNGGGDKLGVRHRRVRHGACEPRGRRPARRCGRLPRRPRSPTAADYVGALRGRRRPRRSTCEAVDDGLSVAIGGARRCASSATRSADEVGDAFLVAHEALDRFPLRFVRDDDGVGRRGVPRAHVVPRRALPRRRARLRCRRSSSATSGLYRNDSPWNPVVRVLARKGRLELDWPYDSGDQGGGPMIPLDDGSFAVGAERDPRAGAVRGRDVRWAHRRGARERRSLVPLVRRGCPRRLGRLDLLLAHEADRLAVGPHVELGRLRARAR